MTEGDAAPYVTSVNPGSGPGRNRSIGNLNAKGLDTGFRRYDEQEGGFFSRLYDEWERGFFLTIVTPAEAGVQDS